MSYPLADYAIYRLARLYEGMNNRTRAIKWYTQLVKDYPTSFYFLEAKWALAQLHLEAKQYASAKSVLVELVKQPRYAREVSFALARCNEELGDIPTAFNTYRELITENHSKSVARDALSRLRRLARANKTLKLTPTDRLNCGLVSFSHKQWKVAVAIWN